MLLKIQKHYYKTIWHFKNLDPTLQNNAKHNPLANTIFAKTTKNRTISNIILTHFFRKRAIYKFSHYNNSLHYYCKLQHKTNIKTYNQKIISTNHTIRNWHIHYKYYFQNGKPNTEFRKFNVTRFLRYYNFN